MKRILWGALLVSMASINAQAEDQACGFEKGVSRAVLQEERVHKTLIQKEQVLLRPELVLSETHYVIVPKRYKLAQAVTLTDPFRVTLPAGTGVTAWLGHSGEKLCIDSLKESYLSGPKVRWLCLKDKDGDGSYETFQGPISKKKVKSGDYPELALEAPVVMTESLPGDPENETQEHLRGERLIIKELQNGRITIEHQQGPSMMWVDGRRFFYEVFAGGDERKVIDATVSSIVEMAGHIITIDSADKINPKVSVKGNFVSKAEMKCGNTIAVRNGPYSLLTTFE